MKTFGALFGVICLILAPFTAGISLVVYVAYLLMRIGWGMGDNK
jgi:hypothetical protein